MGKNNTIEINGKNYDAGTGESLSRDAHRQSAKNAARHSPKTSRTLMRQSVKKPALKAGQLRAQGHTDSLVQKPMSELVTTKLSAKSLDEQKLRHAKEVSQSRLISHFSAVTSDNGSQPALPAAEPQPVAAPAVPRRPVALAKPKSGNPRTTAELLDHALRHASTHEATPLRRSSRRKHRTRLVSAAAVLLLLTGVGVYLQMPNLRLHVAGAKAGLSAGLPGYQPSGYSVGQINYSRGIVATKFKSNSDQRTYTLIQKSTHWDSRALRDSFVAKADQNYLTVEAGDRTIYLYGNRNATWAKDGVWYIVQSNGVLTDDQLVQVATSL